MLAKAQKRKSNYYNDFNNESASVSDKSTEKLHRAETRRPTHYEKPDNSRKASRGRTKNSKSRRTTAKPVSYEDSSGESLDFEEIPSANLRTRTTSSGSGSTETQEFAESASFVSSHNNFNGYNYDKQRNSKEIDSLTSSRSNHKTTTSTSTPATITTTSTTTTTKRPTTSNTKFAKLIQTTIQPTTYSRRGSITYNSQEKKQNLIRSDVKSTSPPSPDFQRINTHTTARRIDTTKNRDIPFYTPTIPTILNKITIDELTTKAPVPTQSSSSPKEHAIEMMKTLQHLEFNTANPISDAEKYLGGQRSGLSIPPSSGPETLHTLALYFATAVEDMSTKFPELSTNFPIISTTNAPTTVEIKTTTVEPITTNADLEKETQSAITSALLSEKTVTKYDQLFGVDNEQNETVTESSADIGLSSRIDLDETNDLEGAYSKGPFTAAGTPEIRELAQVFTHALSAYLNDPVTFRKVLSEIRPTEPTLITPDEIVSNRIGRTEILDSSSSSLSTAGATYLPRITTTTTAPTTTENLEVLDFSDVTLSTKKDVTSSSFEETTTTMLSIETTTNFDKITEGTTQKSSVVSSNSIVDADKTPASKLVTENLERSATSYYSREVKKTTVPPTSNPIADEINGGLVVTTKFPYISIESLESSNETVDDSSYFPLDSIESKTVKPENNSVSYTTTVKEELTTENPSYVTLSPEQLLPSFINYKIRGGFSAPSNDILPPSDEIPEIDENLLRAHSQSIVSSRDNNIQEHRQEKKLSGSKFVVNSITESSNPIKGHYITKEIPSTTTPYPTTTTSEFPSTTTSDFAKTTFPDTGKLSTPYSSFAYTVFLDPLTINDGLMESFEDKTVTPSPNTYLPRSTTVVSEPTTPYEVTTSGSATKFTFDTSSFATINKETIPAKLVDDRQGKSVSTTTSTKSRIDNDDYDDDDYKEVEIETTMQQRANEMFGSLNDTEAGHLMNVMKKGDKNKTVRRLILLLIQTCDDDYNGSVEDSRNALLKALIGMDGDENQLQIINTRSHRRNKSIKSAVPVTEGTQSPVEITTYKSSSHDKYTTSAEITTTTPELQTSTSSNDDTTKSIDYSGETTKFINRFSFESSELTERPQSTIIVSSEEDVSSTQTVITTTEDYSTIVPSTTTTWTTERTEEDETTTKQKTRRGKSLDRELGDPSQDLETQSSDNNKHSDTRALELLKSLYSLAAKWGKR